MDVEGARLGLVLELVQQNFRLPEVGGVEPFGEPAASLAEHLFCFGALFALLIFELSVVKDFADGGISGWRDFNKIKPSFLSGQQARISLWVSGELPPTISLPAISTGDPI